MDKFLEFREFVKSKPDSDFAQEFVLDLVNEVIRLKIIHEGLIDPKEENYEKEDC